MNTETEEEKNIYTLYQKQYIEAGISVIPAKWGSKMPAIKNWTEYCYRLPTVDERMSWMRNFSETNLDVALGEASGIIALDLDCTDQRILDVIVPMLPESPVVKKALRARRAFSDTPENRPRR